MCIIHITQTERDLLINLLFYSLEVIFNFFIDELEIFHTAHQLTQASWKYLSHPMLYIVENN